MIETTTPAPVAIVGLGLMGGSLARALKLLPRPPVIRASTEDAAVIGRAVEDGVADVVSRDPREILEGARLVVYATPVSVTIELLPRHRELFDDDAVVIDVGGVKEPVLEAARAAGIAHRFVGCHPMCGRERSGYDAANATLFAGAIVWLVAGSPTAPLESIATLWRGVSAVPRAIEAQAHDRLVAWSSHLPQLLASALGGALSDAGVRPDVLGPGGRDMTRLARSPAALWVDILLQNRAQLREPIAALGARLGAIAGALERADAQAVERLLGDGRAWTDES